MTLIETSNLNALSLPSLTELAEKDKPVIVSPKKKDDNKGVVNVTIRTEAQLPMMAEEKEEQDKRKEEVEKGPSLCESSLQ